MGCVGKLEAMYVVLSGSGVVEGRFFGGDGIRVEFLRIRWSEFW